MSDLVITSGSAVTRTTYSFNTWTTSGTGDVMFTDFIAFVQLLETPENNYIKSKAQKIIEFILIEYLLITGVDF